MSSARPRRRLPSHSRTGKPWSCVSSRCCVALVRGATVVYLAGKSKAVRRVAVIPQRLSANRSTQASACHRLEAYRASAIHLQRGNEGLLRNVDLAELPHL